MMSANVQRCELQRCSNPNTAKQGFHRTLLSIDGDPPSFDWFARQTYRAIGVIALGRGAERRANPSKRYQEQPGWHSRLWQSRQPFI